MKRILVISVLISFLFSQQDHFMLGVWPGNNCIDPGCAEVDQSLFTPYQLHRLKELKIDAIIQSQDWIFGAAVDSGFKIIYKPFWWIEGYNYGQRWEYKVGNDVQFDTTYLLGIFIDDNSLPNERFKVNMADPSLHSAGFVMDSLKVTWQQDRSTRQHMDDSLGTIFEYKANFLLKVGDNTGHIPVATLFVERGNDEVPNINTQWSVLDSMTIYADDFQTTTDYDTFTLEFNQEDVLPLSMAARDSLYAINREAVYVHDYCMNFRVYWHGLKTLYTWKVEVIDQFAEAVFSGNIDSRIDSILTDPNSEHVIYYYHDEPEADELEVERYITEKVKAQGKKEYTNLYPSYCPYYGYDTDYRSGELEGYPYYLGKVEELLDPDYSGADHYPDFIYGDHNLRINNFISELQLNQSVANKKLFYQVDCGINGIWIDINTYLPIAYGAKGIIFFHWWALSNYDSRYEFVKIITEHIRSIEDHLVGLVPFETYSPPLSFPDNSIISSISEDSLVIGEFTNVDSAGTYLFVVNLRIGENDTRTFQIEVNGLPTQKVEYLSDKHFGTDPGDIVFHVDQPTVIPVTLGPGEGKLIRIVNTYDTMLTGDISGTIADNAVMYGSVRVLQTLTVNPSGSLTILPGTNIKVSTGKQILILGGLDIQGGTFSAMVDNADWGGLVLYTNSNIHISNAVFRDGEIMGVVVLKCGNETVIQNSTFDEFPVIVSSDTLNQLTLLISQSTFKNAHHPDPDQGE
ncbi:MAG: hypothetical protein ACE5EE_11265, partial [Fidelibacterota bacterium]